MEYAQPPDPRLLQQTRPPAQALLPRPRNPTIESEGLIGLVGDRAVRPPRPAQVLQLQRRAGNRAVQGLLQPSSERITVQRFAVGDDLDVVADYASWADPARSPVSDALRDVGFALWSQFHAAVLSQVESPPARTAVFTGVKVLLDNNAIVPVFANGSEAHKKAIMSVFWAGKKGTFRTSPAGVEVFATEVLQTAGWLEGALAIKAGKLSAAGANLRSSLGFVTKQYEQPRSPEAAAPEPLNEDLLRARLAPKLIAVLESHDPEGHETISRPLDDPLRTKANLIQDEAVGFFSPYAQSANTDFSHALRHGGGWRYSKSLVDLQLEEFPDETRMAYLLNRAGHSEVGVFEEAHVYSSRPTDVAIVTEILTNLLQNTNIASLVDRHLKATSRTDPVSKIVHLQTVLQRKAPGDEGKARAEWSMIHTLCHELMHVMTHPVFNAARAQVENAMVIKEGFPELLAFELYAYLIRKAHSEPLFAAALTNGLAPGDLPSPPPRSEMDYGDAAQRAAAVMDSVGEKRVVTAFFLGKPHLVGVGADL